jgi:SHS2 domain-containing protein
VRAREERTVRATGRDPGELVVAFLGELLALQDTEGFLARTVDVTVHGDPPTSLEARLVGEPFDPSRHTARTEVKAATYHDLQFDPVAGKARVIVDI